MKSIARLSRIVYVVLSITLLLLTGCGNDSATETFTANQVSGKTFAYASAGSTGTIVFNSDSSWNVIIGTSSFSGTWSITNGKLVCLTTGGGNHTTTYTLTSVAGNALNATVVEVNPADPNNPTNYSVTFTAVSAANQVSGKTFTYVSSTGSTGTLTFNADNTWNTTIGSLNFSGTWSIDSNGKLVCVTTAGGNHTITYTLTNASNNSLSATAVEVNPADPTNPTNYSATFTARFAASQLSGKSFAYSGAGSTGTLALNANNSWSITIGSATFSGTWSVDANGKLVCVTTTGGNHTTTYTLFVNNAGNTLTSSVVEVNPADPANPSRYTATFSPT